MVSGGQSSLDFNDPDDSRRSYIASKSFRAYSFASSDPERHAILNKILSSYKFSASHLNLFLRCPTSFLYEGLLKAKFPPSTAMIKGSVVHNLLDWWFREYKKQQLFPSAGDTHVEFKAQLTKLIQRYQLTISDSEIRSLLHLVQDYVELNRGRWNKVAVTEFHIPKVVFQNVPMTGFIDKIEFGQNSANVVDYKTGNPERAFELMKFNKDYWRQLIVYVLLLKEAKPDWNVETVELCSIAKSGKRSFLNKKIKVATDDLEHVQDQIVTSYKMISALDFPACQNTNCYWCDFNIKKSPAT